MKPTKKSVAFVVYHPDQEHFIAVLRPPDDDSLPNVWGLPAGSLQHGETFESAVLRAAKQKLGIDGRITAFVGEDTIERKNFVLHMKEYEVEITAGIPSVPQNVPRLTQYVEWKWALPNDLQKAAAEGSLCSRIFLSQRSA